MAKLKHLLAAISFLTIVTTGWAQSYSVQYRSVSGDSALLQKAALNTSFSSKAEADLYLYNLTSLLHVRGYITASVDSVFADSSFSEVFIFLGDQYRFSKISIRPEDEALLESIRWPGTAFSGTVDYVLLNKWQQRILDYLEENGHPFGKVSLDSISMNGTEVAAQLKIDRGPVYKIDSIRIHGDVRISNEFLQRHIGISNGSLYNRKKLEGISKRIGELNYVQEEKSSSLDMVASGSVLNLYLKNRKTNQLNALIGFLPNSDALTDGKKFLLTVDANVLWRNALGNGETLGLVWQQLQQKSPRLNILMDFPYAFRSPFGINFLFDMYKRDSTFLNMNLNLGTSYRIEDRQTATVFLQRRSTIVNGVNTNAVLQSRTLPREGDVSSLNLGVGYSFSNTDFRFNPTRGNELTITSTAGTKKLRRNNQILELKDPTEPSFDFASLYDTVKLKAYQFRVTAYGAHFISLGGQSTLKLGINGGIYQSATYFRNELFQIGGFRLLRGFDEESQFVSQYAVGTTEYRLRTGLNSFFFAFIDGGWGKHLLETKQGHSYFGTGIGLSFETKAGIINFAGALGKRDDTQINLRQVKLHLGFASYF